MLYTKSNESTIDIFLLILYPNPDTNGSNINKSTGPEFSLFVITIDFSTPFITLQLSSIYKLRCLLVFNKPNLLYLIKYISQFVVPNTKSPCLFTVVVLGNPSKILYKFRYRTDREFYEIETYYFMKRGLFVYT